MKRTPCSNLIFPYTLPHPRLISRLFLSSSCRLPFASPFSSSSSPPLPSSSLLPSRPRTSFLPTNRKSSPSSLLPSSIRPKSYRPSSLTFRLSLTPPTPLPSTTSAMPPIRPMPASGYSRPMPAHRSSWPANSWPKAGNCRTSAWNAPPKSRRFCSDRQLANRLKGIVFTGSVGRKKFRRLFTPWGEIDQFVYVIWSLTIYVFK